MNIDTPEHKLWIAVANQAFVDYKYALRGVAYRFKKKGILNFRNVDQIHHEISSKWFANICDFIDIDQSHILRLLNKLRSEVKEDVTKRGKSA